MWHCKNLQHDDAYLGMFAFGIMLDALSFIRDAYGFDLVPDVHHGWQRAVLFRIVAVFHLCIQKIELLVKSENAQDLLLF